MIRLIYRPLPAWTDPVTSPRRPHIFKATWSATLTLLRREVEMITTDWGEVEVVLQVQADERAMRRDGGIRADAKVHDDGVVVSFESKHGPLRYACDTFTSQWYGQLPGWQANVRAVALGLEALRAVDRYGIAGSGEQYRGWNALGSGIPMGAAMTREDARKVLAGWQEYPGEAGANWWHRGNTWIDVLYRRGAKVLHPDAGGDPDEFKRLAAARDLLRG